MAARYWVGGTAAWDTTAGSKWALTSGGTGDQAVPTAADDVFFDANSTGNCTLSGSPVCRSLNFTGFTGTLTHPSSLTVTIGDATAGAGNIALKLVSGMTYSPVNISSAFKFVSTSTTLQTIAFGTKGAGHITFEGAGATWQLQDAYNGGSGQINLVSGTLDTNGQTILCSSFSFGFGNLARTLSPGASVFTLTTGGDVMYVSGSNSSITTNTAIFNFSSSNSRFGVPSTSSNWAGASVNFNGSGTCQIYGTGFTNVSRVGTSTKTEILQFMNDATISGTLTLTGQSAINRLYACSGTPSVPRTLTVGTLVATNLDVRDITAAGAASWDLSAVTGNSGDAGGNTGITFSAAVAQTRTGAGGNWSTAANWTSRVPLPQDNATVGASASGTITADMPRLGKNIDFTGFTGTASFSSLANESFGSWTFVSGMTVTGTQPIYLSGRSVHTITSAGQMFPSGGLTLQGGSSTYTLQDPLATTGTLTVSDGTFATGSYAVTCGIFAGSSGRTTVLNAGNSTISLTTATASTIFNISSTATTVSMSASTVILTAASANTRTMYASAKTIGTLTYTVASSPGQLRFGDSFVIGTLNVGTGRILTLTSSQTTTITNAFAVNGQNNGYLYLPGVSGAYASTVDSAPLSVTGDFDLRVRVALDDWTPAADMYLLAKQGSSGTYSYSLRTAATTGRLILRVSTDGTATTDATSSVAPTIGDGAVLWVRVTWRASDGRTQFFTASGALTSPVESDFIQLGTDQTANVGSIFNSTAVLEVGSATTGTTNLAIGKFYQAQVFNGIDGTSVYNANFTTKAFGTNSFAESSASAGTVTINGTLAQAGDGRIALNSSSVGQRATLAKTSGVIVANYLAIQDSAASGGANWHAINSTSISNNIGWNFSAVPNTANNMALFR